MIVFSVDTRKTPLIRACAVMLAAVLFGCIILSGCGAKKEKQPPDPDSIRTFIFHMEFSCEVRYDFSSGTISANYHGEQPVEARLTGAEAERYEEALKSFYNDVFENHAQFYGHPDQEAYALW